MNQSTTAQPQHSYTNLLWNLLPFLFLLSMLLLFHRNIHSFDQDDSMYGQVPAQYSFSEYMRYQYYGLSGRLSSFATIYIVRSYHVRVWRVLNSMVITGLCASLSSLVLGIQFLLRDRLKNASTIWFICLGLGFININVLGSSVFWITGSFIYLWPITAGCLALIPFRERLTSGEFRITPRSFLFYLIPPLAGIYAGLGQEQIAMMVVLLMIAGDIALYRSHNRVDPYLITITILTVISAVVQLTAPGNQGRYEFELQNALPGFSEMTDIQHLVLGISWVMDKIINFNRLLLILIFSFLAISFSTKAVSRVDSALMTFTVFTSAFLVVSSFHLDYLHPGLQSWVHETFYTFNEYPDFANAYARLDKNPNFFLYFIPYLIWVPVILTTPFLLLKGFREQSFNGWVSAISFTVAFCTLAALAFSPTIFLSGNRTVAVFSFTLLFIASGLFHFIKQRIALPIILAIFSVAALNLGFLWIEWSRNYFIYW